MGKCTVCSELEKLHRCVGCGKWFCEEHIEYSPDPYAYDVGNDDTPVWECDDCRMESAADI